MQSVRMSGFAVGGLLLVGDGVSAFSVSSRRSTIKMESSLLDKFPNPFANDSSTPRPPSLFPSSPQVSDNFQAAPEALVAKAKTILASDFGVLDESLLDDKFIWIGPTLGSKVLGKADYLAAGKYFDLRAAFPDLDYRSHDFRIDDKDPLTIRLTARTVGSMRGELRLRNEIVPPNGVQMRCPPEAISMTFDEKTAKLVKLCSGFAMDRLVGNTGGLCGVMGAATVAGFPPSEWEVYPATTVVQRFIGRPIQQLEEPSSFLAPFPETVMIQLAKGILAADMAAEDPDLLGNSFTFCTPYFGPINKKKYIESYAAEVFGGTEPELTHFRVDPYDPYRVWVDVRQPEGSPEAMSFAFDDDGFCTRITAWAVMDPSIGNSGGLGGKAGVMYAQGTAMPGIASRPLPQVLGRVQKRIFEPITKVGVDDYRLPGGGPAAAEESVGEAKSAPKSPLSQISLKPDLKPKAPAAKASAPKKEAATSKAPFFASPQLNIPVEPKKTPPAPQIKSPQIKKATVDKKAEAQAAAAERKAKAEQAAAEKKAKAEQAAAEKKAKAEQAAAEKKAKAEQAAAEKKAKAEQAAAEKKAKAERAAAAKAAKAREAAAERKAKAEAAAAAREAKAAEAAAARKAKAEAAAAAAAGRKAKPARAVTRTVSPKKKPEKAAQGTTRTVSSKKKPEKAEQGGAFLKAKAAADAALKKAKGEQDAAAAKKAKAEEAAAAKKAQADALAAAKAAKAEKAAAAKKAKAEAAAASRQAKAEAAAAAKKQREEAAAAAKKAREDALKAKAAAAPKKLTPAPKKATPVPQLKVAPKGVPTLAKWRKNRDGSVTGLITGSDIFEDGEKITTSEIETGEFKKGNVVQTSSGSKYFLS